MSRRLYRSSSDTMLGGVCSGLATYLGIDPVIVRAAFVLATFADGIGILAYIVLLILVPKQPWFMPGTESAPQDIPAPPEHRTTPAFWFGLILVAIGIMAFANEILPWFDTDVLWPVVLIVLGGGLIYRSWHTNKRVLL